MIIPSFTSSGEEEWKWERASITLETTQYETLSFDKFTVSGSPSQLTFSISGTKEDGTISGIYGWSNVSNVTTKKTFDISDYESISFSLGTYDTESGSRSCTVSNIIFN